MPVLPVSLMILYFPHLTFLSLFLFISISMLFLEGHCCLPSGSRALVLILPHCAEAHTKIDIDNSLRTTLIFLPGASKELQDSFSSVALMQYFQVS